MNKYAAALQMFRKKVMNVREKYAEEAKENIRIALNVPENFIDSKSSIPLKKPPGSLQANESHPMLDTLSY
jgi:hypothetical protein